MKESVMRLFLEAVAEIINSNKLKIWDLERKIELLEKELKEAKSHV